MNGASTCKNMSDAYFNRQDLYLCLFCQSQDPPWQKKERQSFLWGSLYREFSRIFRHLPAMYLTLLKECLESVSGKNESCWIALDSDSLRGSVSFKKGVLVRWSVCETPWLHRFQGLVIAVVIKTDNEVHFMLPFAKSHSMQAFLFIHTTCLQTGATQWISLGRNWMKVCTSHFNNYLSSLTVGFSSHLVAILKNSYKTLVPLDMVWWHCKSYDCKPWLKKENLCWLWIFHILI